MVALRCLFSTASFIVIIMFTCFQCISARVAVDLRLRECIWRRWRCARRRVQERKYLRTQTQNSNVPGYRPCLKLAVSVVFAQKQAVQVIKPCHLIFLTLSSRSSASILYTSPDGCACNTDQGEFTTLDDYSYEGQVSRL